MFDVEILEQGALIVNKLALNIENDVLRLGHASGVTPTRVKAHPSDDPPGVGFDDLGFSRTSRRIMEGRAFFPAALREPGV